MPKARTRNNSPDVAVLRNRLIELKAEMNALGVVMRGSVVVIGVRNKQPYFSVNQSGKTHLIYLGKKREREARQYSANYQRLRQIVEEMTVINMTLLKSDASSA
jgi:hypothetical protein